MLSSILNTEAMSSVSAAQFIACSLISLVLGAALAGVHIYKNRTTASFELTLAVLPLIVQTVIMLVNGNLGTGIAVMGAFSLVRFRSMPGNAREIAAVFTAMALGLAMGTGYVTVAVLLLAIVAAATIIFETIVSSGQVLALNRIATERELKVTIPENLDYSGIFDDIFSRFTASSELVKVKTVNMGSMYELVYHVVLKDPVQEKSMLDEIRCRNGNLNIVCGKIPESRESL